MALVEVVALPAHMDAAAVAVADTRVQMEPTAKLKTGTRNLLLAV